MDEFVLNIDVEGFAVAAAGRYASGMRYGVTSDILTYLTMATSYLKD